MKALLEKPAKAPFLERFGIDSLLSVNLKSPASVLAITTVANLLIRMASTIFLTRLLAPDVFGLAGIITSIFFTISMLTDLGFQSYVVRHPHGDDPHFRNVIWTVHVVRGLCLAAIAAACAPLAAHVLQKPELALPLAVASLQLAIDGFTSIAIMAALRNNGANKLSLLDLGLTLFQTVVSIILAFWLRNIWAIVFSGLAHTLLRSILSYAIFPASRHRPASDTATRRDFFAFSRVVMASSFLTLLLSQADKFVLARLFTLEQFGLYALAFNLAFISASFANTYVSRVAYPTYSRTWHEAPHAMRDVFYGIKRKVSILFAIGSGGIIGGAPVIIRILYDPRYEAAALFLAILAISSALRLPAVAAAEVMTAIGKVKITLYLNIARVAWILIAGPIGYVLGGGFGIVVAVGLLEAPALVASWFFLGREKLLNVPQELLYLALVGLSTLGASVVAAWVVNYLPI